MAVEERFTIEEFPAWLRGEKDLINRRMGRFFFDFTSGLKKEIILNIKKTFTKTTRTNSRGKEVGSARGLINSVNIQFGSGFSEVVVGGVSVPYAAIHEYGGTIEPVRAKWLTIPAAPEFVGKRAAEFENRLKWSPAGPALVFKDDPERVAFWLKKSVRMPARPYIDPAVQLMLSPERLDDLIQKHFKLGKPTQ